MDTWICGSSVPPTPYPLSQEGHHRYPDPCLSASPRAMSCCLEPASPTSSPGAASLAGPASACLGGPGLSGGLGSGPGTQPAAGLATWHGVGALSPCSSCLRRARGAESQPIGCALSIPVSRQLPGALSPPSPAGITVRNHRTLLNARDQPARSSCQLMGDTGWGFPGQESSAAASQGPAQSRLGTKPL